MNDERVFRIEFGRNVFVGLYCLVVLSVVMVWFARVWMMDHQAQLDREQYDYSLQTLEEWQFQKWLGQQPNSSNSLDPQCVPQEQSLPLSQHTRGAMRVYLSARFQRQEEMRRYAAQLRDQAIEVVSAWHDVDVASIDGFTGLDDQRRAWLAMLDLQQLMGTNVLIGFTEDNASQVHRPVDETGQRFAEFGISLALGKRLLLVGGPENCYHCLPDIEHFPTWPDAFSRVLELRGTDAMTTRQAAKEANTTVQQIGMWIREGRLPAAKHRGRYVIGRNDLDRAKAIHLRNRADALAKINDGRLFPIGE